MAKCELAHLNPSSGPKQYLMYRNSYSFILLNLTSPLVLLILIDTLLSVLIITPTNMSLLVGLSLSILNKVHVTLN